MTAFLLAAALMVGADPPPQPVVAVVANLKGECTFQRGTEKRPLRRADLLRIGDVLEIADSATVVFLDDGHLEDAKAKQKITICEKGCDRSDAAVRRDAKLKDRNLSALRELAESGRVGVINFRGNQGQPLPTHISPINGATLLTDRPELSWPAVDKAKSYRVHLLSGAEGKDEHSIWQAETNQPKLPYPEKEKPLERGLKYRWQVFAISENKRETIAHLGSFLIATARMTEQIGKIGPLAASADPADNLLAALTYEAWGAWGDALPLYEKLADKSPTDGNLMATLGAYYERAGMEKESKAAWEKAEKNGVLRPKE
jgi:hypothetical protein